MDEFTRFFYRMNRIGIKNQTQLADILGVTAQAVTDAKRRDTVPAIWCAKISQFFDLPFDWVIGHKAVLDTENLRSKELELIRECLIGVNELRQEMDRVKQAILKLQGKG